MLEKNIDTVVLGCTHYPLVIPLIQQIVGNNVRVIDPAPAVAKQTERLLETKGTRASFESKGEVKFYTSGNPAELKSLLPKLLGESGEVERVKWLNDMQIK
jgi:glutamate racemase